ncbi:MAG: hypothetical protein GYB64_10000 [Chloroflexi bacterium]|nr:hypothetical protein [Chloroflexota bacterium]
MAPAPAAQQRTVARWVLGTLLGWLVGPMLGGSALIAVTAVRSTFLLVLNPDNTLVTLLNPPLVLIWVWFTALGAIVALCQLIVSGLRMARVPAEPYIAVSAIGLGTSAVVASVVTGLLIRILPAPLLFGGTFGGAVGLSYLTALRSRVPGIAPMAAWAGCGWAAAGMIGLAALIDTPTPAAGLAAWFAAGLANGLLTSVIAVGRPPSVL